LASTSTAGQHVTIVKQKHSVDITQWFGACILEVSYGLKTVSTLEQTRYPKFLVVPRGTAETNSHVQISSDKRTDI